MLLRLCEEMKKCLYQAVFLLLVRYEIWWEGRSRFGLFRFSNVCFGMNFDVTTLKHGRFFMDIILNVKLRHTMGCEI